MSNRPRTRGVGGGVVMCVRKFMENDEDEECSESVDTRVNDYMKRTSSFPSLSVGVCAHAHACNAMEEHQKIARVSGTTRDINFRT